MLENAVRRTRVSDQTELAQIRTGRRDLFQEEVEVADLEKAKRKSLIAAGIFRNQNFAKQCDKDGLISTVHWPTYQLQVIGPIRDAFSRILWQNLTLKMAREHEDN